MEHLHICGCYLYIISIDYEKSNLYSSFIFSYQVTAQNFSSDSNIVFLENQLNRINIYINQSSLNSLLNMTSSDIMYDSSMEFISSNQVFYLNNVGIRLRGNTSLTAPKKKL